MLKTPWYPSVSICIDHVQFKWETTISLPKSFTNSQVSHNVLVIDGNLTLSMVNGGSNKLVKTIYTSFNIKKKRWLPWPLIVCCDYSFLRLEWGFWKEFFLAYIQSESAHFQVRPKFERIKCFRHPAAMAPKSTWWGAPQSSFLACLGC